MNNPNQPPMIGPDPESMGVPQDQLVAPLTGREVTPLADDLTPPESRLPEPPVNPGVAVEAAPAKSGNFFTRRLRQIREGYEGLSGKQKDVLQMGAMALSATVLPAIGAVTGNEAAINVLKFEGLVGFGALEVAAGLKLLKLQRRLPQPQRFSS